MKTPVSAGLYNSGYCASDPTFLKRAPIRLIKHMQPYRFSAELMTPPHKNTPIVTCGEVMMSLENEL